MIFVCFGILFGVMMVCNIFIFKIVRDSKCWVIVVVNSINLIKVEDFELNLSIVIKDDVLKLYDVIVIINDRFFIYFVESGCVIF